MNNKTLLHKLLGLCLLDGFFKPKLYSSSGPEKEFNLAIGIDSQTNESCSGADDGSISFTITGIPGNTLTVILSSTTVAGVTEQLDYTNLTSSTISASYNNLKPGTYFIQFQTTTPQFEFGMSSNIVIDAYGLDFQVNATSPTCNGGTDGSIDLAGSGGTAPYTYSVNGSSFRTQTSFTGLSAGSYNLVIKDATGCEVSQTFDLTQPDAITATLMPTSPSCTTPQATLSAGLDSDGSITVQATGGTAPFTYSIDGGNSFVSTATITGLTAGNYSVIIRDANGCQITETTTIDPPTPITASLVSSTNISCFGQTDGTITLNATGGNGTYGVIITDVNTGSQNVLGMTPNTAITNFAAGTYDLMVRDGKNCMVSNAIRIEITAPTAPLAADSFINSNTTGGTNTITGATVTTTFCNGSTMGLTLSATGGTTPYEYSLDGMNYVSNPVFTNLTPGTYGIYVRDANGCVDSPVFTRTFVEADPITFNVATTDVTCFNGDDGIITVSGLAGGLSSATYSIDGVNFNNFPQFTGLSAGTYTVTVNAGNCFSTMTATVNHVDNVTVTPNVLSNVDCVGGTNGSVEINVTGAPSPVAYSISPINNTNRQASNTYTNLAAGNYTVDVIYGPDNCVVSTNFTITEPATAVSSTFSKVDVTCNGEATGAFTVTASGGAAPYQYFLQGQTPQSSNEFTGLTAGFYNFFVADANNCFAVNTVEITEPDPINITYQALPPSCIGNSDGRIFINLGSGGTAPIRIRLQGITTTNSSIANLAPGDYDVEAVDANGCIVTSSVTVPEASSLTADVTVDSNASGCGNADGAFTLSNPKKGNQNIPNVEYSIDGVNYQSTATFSGLAAGAYTVNIRDITPANQSTGNCTGTVSVTITEPSGITGSIAFTNIDCNGDMDGTVTVSGVSGGTAPYEYSIDGMNFGSSGAFTSLSGGMYNVTVRDASGCTLTLSATVTEPTAITGSLSITDSFCNGANDGEIAVSVSGGTGSHEFSLDGTNFQESNRFDGLMPGAYTVTVRDDNSCTIQLMGTVSEPTAIVASFTGTTNVTCNGGSDGTATLSVTGGTAPYEVSIDGTQYLPLPPNGVFTNIGPTEITTVLVRDANGCEVSIPGFTITEPDPLMANLNVTNVSCNGNGDGSITIVPVSTTSTVFEYSIDGNIFSTNATYSSLTPGSYTVTMRDDGTGCSNTFTATITEPDMISPTFNTVDMSCHDAQDGQILSMVTGGTAPYEYSLDGTNFQSMDFSGLAMGSYTITVRDANNCTATNTVSIGAPDQLLIESSQVTDATCNGAMDGSAMVTASGGTMPYEYSLNGVDFSASIDLSQLAAGNYTVTVKDANECESTVSFTINEPMAIQAIVSVVNQVTCNGGTDGSFTVTASAGQGTYTYSLDGTNFSNSDTFSGLSAGTYTVTVQDASNCTATVTQTITEPAALDLQFESVNVTCFGANDGQIAGSASGGTAPYTFSLDGTNFQSTAFSGLQAGNYTLTVKDANDCEATTTVQISEPAVLTASLSNSSNVSCNGASDGTLSLSISGGTAPYSTSKDGTNFDTSLNFLGLTAGSFTITVRDANNCTTTVMATITEPDVLAVSANGSTLLCHGDSDGSVSATATGGTSPYEYSLDGTNFQASGSFGSLAAGSYTLTVKDANGCISSSAASIVEPDANTVTSTIEEDACNGDASGAIDVMAQGGTGNLEYSLDGTNFQASNTFSGLATGMYTLTVRDTNGCTITATETISEPVAITANTTATDVTCNGEMDGIITVTASGGTGNLEFSLDGTDFQASDSFTGLAAGAYTITVRDANSCTITATATIAEPTALTVTTTVVDATCNGDSNGSITVTASGGTGTLEYSLDGSTFQAGDSFTGLAAGNYTITARDANGCSVTTTTTISEPAALVVSASIVNDNTIMVSASGGTAPYEYAIDGTNFQSSSTFDRLSNGNYTLTVRDANGCTTSTSQSLIITSTDEPFIPTVVSLYPNPSRDIVTITGLVRGDVIRLINPEGKAINLIEITSQQRTYQMKVSSYKEGIYIIAVNNMDGRRKSTQKLMIFR